MIIKWIDLALSRLKQGFDSPRERHKIKHLEDTFCVGSKMGPISFAYVTGQVIAGFLPFHAEPTHQKQRTLRAILLVSSLENPDGIVAPCLSIQVIF